MQTFMPMINFRASLDALDPERLNKQILECSQMITIITDPTRGYQNHPAVTMWRRHVRALCTYGGVAAAAYRDAKGAAYDKRQVWFYDKAVELAPKYPQYSMLIPPWVGDLNFHRSHRSNLMRKDPSYYHWDGTPELMPYLWPVTTGRDTYDLYVSRADMERLETGERVMPGWLQIGEDRKVQTVAVV